MVESRRPSPGEWRYVPILACVLLVVLRLSIGWQFLYEGLWKIDTLDSTRPWSAEGYLKNAEGPFREIFRESMAEDPNDFRWLDQEWVATRWDDWAARFTRHYGLSDKQQQSLHELLEGEEDFRAVLKELPAGVTIPENLSNTIRFYPRRERLIVAGTEHLTPGERDRLLELVETSESGETTPEQAKTIEAYRDAVNKVFERSSRLSYKERMRVSLGPYDPERVRVVFANFEGTIGNKAPEEIGKFYRELIAAYEANRAQALETDLDFQRSHLTREWEELQKLRVALAGPIKVLERELHDDAQELLTPIQIAQGPVPEEWTRQRVIDMLTITALTALGLLLICGLATRPAAILGAGMLLSFYLVWPPWPGVPEIPGSNEHSFIINKNFIEAIALFALAALPTGQWFGLDRWIWLGWKRLRSRGDGNNAKPADSAANPRETEETVPVGAKT